MAQFNTRPVRSPIVALAAAVALVLLGAAAPAEAADAIPRTAEGRPDLSGIWQTFSRADDDLLPHHARPDAPASLGTVVGGQIPYLPAAAAKRDENFRNRERDDPRGKCFLPGVPRITYTPFPFQIFQAPDRLAVTYEYAHAIRNIYTNGTDHPPGHIDWWLGDSRGHWEGDTLVVSIKHFNGLSWLDHAGNYFSDNATVTERYTPIDADHIRYQVEIDDDKVFSKPWNLELTLYRRKEANFQLLEYDCYIFDFERHYP